MSAPAASVGPRRARRDAAGELPVGGGTLDVVPPGGQAAQPVDRTGERARDGHDRPVAASVDRGERKRLDGIGRDRRESQRGGEHVGGMGRDLVVPRPIGDGTEQHGAHEPVVERLDHSPHQRPRVGAVRSGDQRGDRAGQRSRRPHRATRGVGDDRIQRRGQPDRRRIGGADGAHRHGARQPGVAERPTCRLEPRRARPPALDGATDGGPGRPHVTNPPVELGGHRLRRPPAVGSPRLRREDERLGQCRHLVRTSGALAEVMPHRLGGQRPAPTTETPCPAGQRVTQRQPHHGPRHPVGGHRTSRRDHHTLQQPPSPQRLDRYPAEGLLRRLQHRLINLHQHHFPVLVQLTICRADLYRRTEK